MALLASLTLAPALLGVSVSQISLMINTQIASWLGPGNVTWLDYAGRLMEFPTALLGVALGVVLMPQLASAKAGDDAVRYSSMLDWGLRLVVLMHANPFIIVPRDGYAPLRARLAAIGERMEGKVVLVHGDSHTYHDDEPIPGVRRLEVWGSPIVAWNRGALDDGVLRFSAPRYR